MPDSPPVTDRFDDLPPRRGRIGAHRAENPRLNGRVLLFWSALATVVLVAAGIFGSLVATGRIVLSPAETPAATEQPAEPPSVIDTSFYVLVLNATTQDGLAGAVREQVVAAGWSPDMVDAGDAGSDDFETTTVYYPFAEAESAARGLAEAVGGAQVALSDAYQPLDDEATPDVDESQFRQLVIVVGLDRTAAAEDDDQSTG